MTEAFRRDIQSMYILAEQTDTLSQLIPALYGVLRRNEDSLRGITYAHRLTTIDTGYTCTFALQDGSFSELSPLSTVDVTVSGKETNLLAVFQRKQSATVALMLNKIKVRGSMFALMKLAEFL